MLTVGEKMPEFSVIAVKPGFMAPDQDGESAFETLTDQSFLGK